MTTPVRRHSPAVYRRRRLVLLIVILAVVGAIALLVAQPWRGGTTEPSAAAPSSSAPPSSAPPSATVVTPSPTSTPGTPEPVRSCTAADLTVEALTDATEYPSGQNPQLTLRLTNASARDCTMNVGTTTQTFTIRSGDDVWWRSTDCQTDSADQIVTLAAGQSVTNVAPVVWDRTRSSVDTCGSTRPVAPGGGSTYRLSTSIGGVPSQSDAVFTLD